MPSDDDLGTRLASPSLETRLAALEEVTDRCLHSRSAPAALIPLLGPLLAGETLPAAVLALRRAGSAAAQHADRLATVAAGYPAGDPAAGHAVATLMRLRDPRWVRPVALAAGIHDPGVRELRTVPFSEAVLEEVRHHLAHSPRAAEVLATVVGGWGRDGAPAVPELVKLLEHAPAAAAGALVRAGHAEPAMTPGLRELAARPGGLDHAHALFRLTGDLRPALRALLSARPPVSPAAVEGLGPLLVPLVPEMELALTGSAAASAPQRHSQLLAARITTAALGDPIPALPTVQAVLLSGGQPAADAADFVAEQADRHRPTLLACVPELRHLTTAAEQVNEVAAVRALWRLGATPSELEDALVRAVGRGYRAAEALAVWREMAVAPPAPVVGLAALDTRLPVPGLPDDAVWADEALVAALSVRAA